MRLKQRWNTNLDVAIKHLSSGFTSIALSFSWTCFLTLRVSSCIEWKFKQNGDYETTITFKMIQNAWKVPYSSFPFFLHFKCRFGPKTCLAFVFIPLSHHLPARYLEFFDLRVLVCWTRDLFSLEADAVEMFGACEFSTSVP